MERPLFRGQVPILLAVTCFGLLASACDWTRRFGFAEPIPLTIKTPTLTLIWDPSTDDIPHVPTKVVCYRIYVQEYGGSSWLLLAEIPASEHSEYQVSHDQVGSGAFVFAVQAVSAGGGVSPLHSSLDLSADPIGGWYVRWFY